jgi:RimJ/RimL family protein N-acetyltransferase
MFVPRLTPSHATAYRALMLEAYELHPDAFTSTVAERADLPLSWWAARMADAPNANEAVFGAIVDNTLAGVAGIRFETRAKAAHKATLFGLYVPQRFRKLGFGRGLVDAILTHAKTRSNVLLVQLTVTAGNAPAQRLYESCGFVPFGNEPLAVRVGNTYLSRIHMWCSIRPPPGENEAEVVRRGAP